MPVYEYQCPQCGAVQEVAQSIKDPPRSDVPCTACWLNPPTVFMKRVIAGGTRFTLVGKCWGNDGYTR